MARRPYGTGSLIEREGGGGIVTYYAAVRVDGQRHKIRIGRKRPTGSREGLTKAQAERELQRRIEELRRARPAEGIKLRVALVEYLDFLKRVRGLKRTTLQDYRIIGEAHLLRHFGDFPLEAIDSGNVETFLRAQNRRGLSPNTIRNHFNVLSGLCAFALKRGWIAIDPTKQVERPRLQRTGRRVSFLSPQQFMALLDAMPKDPLGEVQRVVLLVMGLAGLRLGEALGLKVNDIDLEAHRIRVVDSYTRGEEDSPKGGQSRSVPMSSALATGLAMHLETCPPGDWEPIAFRHPETGAHLDPSKLRKHFKAALKRAGLEPIRLHDLRHTFGTQCAAAGVPLRLLQEWMGHADPTTTAIYMHYAPDAVRGQDLIDRAFDGFDGG